jgi:MFS transporter, DHA2 family, multidrug resistance protein
MKSSRWWALGSLALAVLAVGLDGTILSVALPTLGRSLGASTGQLQWFVAAYTLVFAAALVPGGMLGDRYGRKKMLLVSLLVFGAASIACALASSAAAFIAARALLGLGGALMLPMVMGLLPVLFDEKERVRAIGTITAAVMLGYPIGPLLGGWMLTRFDWSWVFLINLPVVALALVAVTVLLPESRSSLRRRIDRVGLVLSSGGLALLTYGVINAGDRGWSDSVALAEMVGGTLGLAAFVLWERRVAAPLVDLRLFRVSAFTWGATLRSLVSFAMFGLLFAAPLYFQVVRGADAQGSGIRLLPLIAGLLVGGAVADRLAARAGASRIAALGFLLFAAGLAFGATTSVATVTRKRSPGSPSPGSDLASCSRPRSTPHSAPSRTTTAASPPASSRRSAWWAAPSAQRFWARSSTPPIATSSSRPSPRHWRDQRARALSRASTPRPPPTQPPCSTPSAAPSSAA